MKKVTYESWVAGFVEKLSDYFNLTGWRIEIRDGDDGERADGNCEYARIYVDPTYLAVILTINKQGRDDFEKRNMDPLVTALVHEFVRVFLAPFNDLLEPHLSDVTRPFFLNILEQQTQKLTMVFLKTLPKSVIPPR